jgi:hypothetical protein
VNIRSRYGRSGLVVRVRKSYAAKRSHPCGNARAVAEAVLEVAETPVVERRWKELLERVAAGISMVQRKPDVCGSVSAKREEMEIRRST